MKKFFLILFGLIVLIGAGLTVFILTFDLNTYREAITAKASEILGRPVKIGSLEMKLSLIPTVKVQDVTIDNPDRFGADDPLLRVDHLEATLAIAPLLSNRVEVQTISFGNMMVNLIDKGGINNWTMKSSDRKSKDSSGGSSDMSDTLISQVRIDNISAKSLKLTYQTPETTQSAVLTDITINQLKVFSMTALLNEIPFKISGTVNSLLDLIAQKPDYLFNLEIAGADMTVKLSGSIGHIQALKDLLLNVDVSGNSLKQTLSAFNVDGRLIPAQSFSLSTVLQGDLKELQIDKFLVLLGGNKLKADLKGAIKLLPQLKATVEGNVHLIDRSLGLFWGVQPFTVETKIVVSPTEVQISSLNLTANRSDVSVSGKVGLAGKPNLTLKLNSEYLDIQDFVLTEPTGYDETNPVHRAKNKLIADTPIDLSFLKQFDANITFSLPHLNITNAFNDYLGLSGVLAVKNGAMTIYPLNVTLLNGSVSGLARVITETAGNDISLQLTGGDLQLNDVKAVDHFVKDASVDVTLNLHASGNSVKSILSTLTGQIFAEIPQGTIINPWFNGLAESLGAGKKHSVNYSTSDAESKIVCGAMNLNLQNGRIQSDNNVAIETSSINFMIGGDINLPAETLDLNMIPSVNMQKDKVNTLLTTAGQFIKIKGTFLDMEPMIDTDKAVQGLMQLAQKKSKTLEPYQLCHTVLGRQPKSQILSEAKKQQMLPEPTPISLEPTKQAKPATFQEQLMDTVSKVLQ